MNKIKIFQVDTFCNELFSGNAAAVCPLNDWLPDEIMQSIALENNLSETAFFIKKNRWMKTNNELFKFMDFSIEFCHFEANF